MIVNMSCGICIFRRERENLEAERAQHLNKIHDLQEHVQEKERQFLELQEHVLYLLFGFVIKNGTRNITKLHIVAQEAILYKYEQIREAQAWIARAQEMDALQSSTNHSLLAELRERTEQYNQLWTGCQRQDNAMLRCSLSADSQDISSSEDSTDDENMNIKNNI
ncbi:hypothetical protein Hanom_Chr13g01220401 [Helianthus anomalus]